MIGVEEAVGVEIERDFGNASSIQDAIRLVDAITGDKCRAFFAERMLQRFRREMLRFDIERGVSSSSLETST